jgi:hypothetical protein
MYIIVSLPVCRRGSASTLTLFDTASRPVYVPPPCAYASRRNAASGAQPMTAAAWRVASNVSGTSWAKPPACESTPYRISTTCVNTKPRKIGSRTRIASFMPRRFSSSNPATITRPVVSFHLWNPTGSSEKSASTPAATEIAIVRT